MNLAYFIWDPKPGMFNFNIPILNRPILWYGFFFALGFFIGYYVLTFLLRRYFTFQAINPSPKKVKICDSEGKPNQRGQSPRSARGAPLPKARATSKIDLAKPQQADCHLFGARVNILNPSDLVAIFLCPAKKSL